MKLLKGLCTFVGSIVVVIVCISFVICSCSSCSSNIGAPDGWQVDNNISGGSDVAFELLSVDSEGAHYQVSFRDTLKDGAHANMYLDNIKINDTSYRCSNRYAEDGIYNDKLTLSGDAYISGDFIQLLINDGEEAATGSFNVKVNSLSSADDYKQLGIEYHAKTQIGKSNYDWQGLEIAYSRKS